jgi:hypothetical protein
MLLLAGCPVFSQEKGEVLPATRMNRLRAALSLSEDQVREFILVDQAFREGLARVRADTSLTREKAIAERKLHFDKREVQLRNLLSDKQYAKWAQIRPPDDRAQSQPGLDDLKVRLALSDEQVKKIAAINSATAHKFRQLRTDTVSVQDRSAAARVIAEQRTVAIRKVLTEEQFAKYVELEKDKSRHRRRRAGP